MSLARLVFEVVGARHIAELLDRSIVDVKTELSEFGLDMFDNLCPVETALLEKLLHGDVGDDRSCLTFDNAHDDGLNVLAAGNASVRGAVCHQTSILD